MSEVRVKLDPNSGGPQLYAVKLVGGPANGMRSVASGDVVYMLGERYVRGPDDLYYHAPEQAAGGGKN